MAGRRDSYYDLKPLRGGGRGDVVFSGGNAVGTELANEELYERNFGYNRYDTILQRHDKKKGVTHQYYLDYDQTAQVKKLMHTLEGKGYSLGDYVDYLALQLVRPKPLKFSALDGTNYALQSIFIDVSSGGQMDGLFNQLAAATIDLMTQLAVDIIATRVRSGEPEQNIRQGFEEITKLKDRKNISPEEKLFWDAADDYLNDVSDAIEAGVKAGKGKFHGISAGENELHYLVGRDIAKALKKEYRRIQSIPNREKRAQAMKEFTTDPTIVFEFYEDIMQKMGLQIKSEVVEKISTERAKQKLELKAANEEISMMEKIITAAGLDTKLANARKAAAGAKKSLAI